MKDRRRPEVQQINFQTEDRKMTSSGIRKTLFEGSLAMIFVLSVPFLIAMCFYGMKALTKALGI